MSLLSQAFVFLAAGVVAVPIASRLGLGSVLGYLIAGTIIGPFVLQLIDNTENIMHFAEFGVVMMLFLVGLELQPQVLWRMRKPILGLGGLQVLLTTAAITGVALLFDFTWQTSLAIGLILSLSSTAIALQILGEKNLLKTEAGKSSFAVLLFQDIAVIPIIALLPLLASQGFEPSHHGEHGNTNIIAHLEAWQQTLIMLCVIAAMIIAGRYLTRPLFKFIAESGLREIFTAAALLLVIGTALLMNLIGLSPALGAFIAGVVLANNEYRHELEANIDPFKSLLLGLFFISVGAGIDFSLIAEKPLLIFGLVIVIVFIKFIILWLLAQRFGLVGSKRYWFVFSLSQAGEFGFVLLSLSSGIKVIDHYTVAVLTAVIALTMAATPILILINEKYVQPYFNLAEEDDAESDMEEDQDTPVILIGFGRFGQIVGRLLIANQIPVTVLDSNARHIARVREFGFKLFYGDGSRADLLETAGAKNAKLLVVTVSNREKINEIVELSKRHFPHLKILVRAYDVIHYHELEALGADYIEREMFRGSLNLGKAALEGLGMTSYKSERRSELFAKHDIETMLKLSQHREDRKKYVSESLLAQDEMMHILEEDTKDHDTQSDT